ncbi:MAG: FAD-dependent monooxygenase [Hyphomonas sp.]|nr:FAD-dependent monooxygenase [Hyphomonas sp.]MBU4062931.1 FAD-dependent monooxygenase [Alphaproteobacteria bacterium]MBU4165463.1 FAD-dependent monooxygenase [Alphaproteobacteria bacterium]MBU4567725.1 FAD-dependent monooxygenase [Alphaproteobacteria bacterium]
MSRCLNIGIAGAGIGGLAAGAFLARDGHRVSVFDQFDAAGPVGSGLMLQETGLVILDQLGLRDAAEGLGAPITRLWGVSADTGRSVLDVRYAALRPALHGIGIQRTALFTLLEGAASASGARLVPATRITAANPETGTLVDHQGGAQGPFDLVIDALGVRSVLSSAPAKALPYGALWATLPWPEKGPFDAEALEQRYQAARKMAGIMPSGRARAGDADSLTYFWSIRSEAYEAFRTAPLAHWKDAARALWPETAMLVDQIVDHDQLTFARYRHRTHWPAAEGRLIHIGDSWHAASPQLGQGANMALLDAFALARAVRGGGTASETAALYVRQRAAHVRLYQLMTWAFTPVYQSDSKLLPWVRDWLAAPVSKLWPAPPVLAALVGGGLGSPLKKLGLKAGR